MRSNTSRVAWGHPGQHLRVAAGSLLILGVAVSAVTPALGLAQVSGGSAVTPIPSAGTGPIAYMRPDEAGLWQVWTSCPDMAHPHQLTSDAWRSGWPAWSPDGSRIAFNSDRDDPARTADAEGAVWDILTMDADGGDVRKLTASVGLSADPHYSRDGSLIAFGWDKPGQAGIHVMDAADGSDKRQITIAPAGASDIGPRFSPDGSELMFLRVTDTGTDGVFIVGLDGTGLRRVTPETTDVHSADWSADGSLIAFQSEVPDARTGGIWLIKPDGTGMTRLADPPPLGGIFQGLSDPTFSPDGSLLLVTYGLHHDDGTVTSGLATMTLDGTGLHYLGDGRDEGEKMDWSSTGGC